MRSFPGIRWVFRTTFVCSILTCAGLHAQENIITIGFVGDFSDVSKAYTENMFLAFQMGVDEINDAGGIRGATVRVIRKDGGNDPQKHRELVKLLTEQERVAAVFGGASSPCVLVASAECRKQQVPYLVSIGNSQSIVVEHGHPYVFLCQPNSRMESKGFSIFLTLMPWRRYAWVGPDYSWGHEVLRHFKQHFEEIGAPIEWTTEAWHPLGTTDYEEIIAQVKRGVPEALVIGSWGADARRFVLQADRAGLLEHTAVFAWFTYEVKGEMGRWLPKGAWILSRGPFNYLAEKYPQTRRFVDNFAAQYDTYPNGFTVCCYDSLLAWRQAVEKAGSAEPAAVAQALRGLEFEGLHGPSRIRAEDGQLNCSAYFGPSGDRPRISVPRAAVGDRGPGGEDVVVGAGGAGATPIAHSVST